MKTICGLIFLSTLSWATPSPVFAQDEEGTESITRDSIRESAEELAADTREKVDEIAERLDQSEQAREVSAGILQPIYKLAEAMSFPSFHWVAFACMTAGVISFALQLVLSKLVVLSKMSVSIKEILADSLGLVISLIGLVLTTQAAAQNSTFTVSPAAVLSSAGAGLVVGLIFYWWGQKEELQAALGRKVARRSEK